MSKSRIPAFNRGLAGQSSKQPKNLNTSKQNTNTSKSSNLLHYGFATEKSNSTKAGGKKAEQKAKDKEKTEKQTNNDMLRDSQEVSTSSKTNSVITEVRKISDNLQDKECGSASKESAAPTAVHLKLSEVQLNALSYSLSELADKLSPSRNDYFDDDEWESSQRSENIGTDRSNSLGRGKNPSDVASALHSKSPYSRQNQSESKPYLSKQKSFNKHIPSASNDLTSSKHDDSSGSRIRTDKESLEKDEIMFKAAAPSHQESTESGYNSSWSTSSLSEDFKNCKHSTDVDTDIDMDLKDLNDESLKVGPNVDEQLKAEIKAEDYEKALQEKISDVEKRINSLILGRNSMDLGTNAAESNSNLEWEGNQESIQKMSSRNNGIVKGEKDETLPKGFQDHLHEKEPNPEINQHKIPEHSKSFDNSKDNDQDLMRKSPFHIQNIHKASLDESRENQKPKRPGLIRRRTTLVTFRPPRQTSAFNEVNDSGILEIDEAGFVQCLTEVRSMKTMLLKLKRELQEAEVVSPLARSTSTLSRSIANLANISEPNDSSEDMGARRNTYDSSEMIHEKLRRIRSASLSRRKKASSLDLSSEDQVTAEENLTEPPCEEIKPNNTDEDMKKMKEEIDDLKEKMKSLKQERDTLLLDKEEIEHELEAKHHTIKLLQKQLEVQENSEEMAFLRRQVVALTYQVRQQQQKITELKYRASTPPNAQRSASPTNFNTKKDSVKHDIKNRLRDAFVRHLEESSKQSASPRAKLDLQRTYSGPLERPTKKTDVTHGRRTP